MGNLQVGAYYSAGGVFSNVTPYAPTSFTTKPEEVFPASLLNTSEGGSGGSAAINWQIDLPVASPPMPMDGASGRQEVLGAKGNTLVFSPAHHPTLLQVNVSMPDLEPGDDSHEETWGEFTELCFSGQRLWALYRSFAFCGYVKSAPLIFMGERQNEVETVTFIMQHFYRAYHSGGNKIYKLLAFGGA